MSISHIVEKVGFSILKFKLPKKLYVIKICVFIKMKVFNIKGSINHTAAVMPYVRKTGVLMGLLIYNRKKVLGWENMKY